MPRSIFPPRGRAAGRAPGRVVLLGPQALEVTLGRVRADLEGEGVLPRDGRIATVTAGWQERELEEEVLSAELEGRGVNLGLYGRFERLQDEDPEYVRAHRATQDRLRLLRRAYNIRLARLIEALTALERLPGEPELLQEERAAALDAIRELDDRHLARVVEVRAALARTHDPAEREAVARHREEVAAILDGAAAVAVAGGHVATLLNRMRTFGLERGLEGKVVIAWSAGAMALGRRVVLFHDCPPWGPGNTEAFENGLRAYPGLVALPYASRRLALDDRRRTGRMARRFAPDACALLDAGTRLEWSDGRWRAVAAARRLAPGGGVVSMPARSRARGGRGTA